MTEALRHLPNPVAATLYDAIDAARQPEDLDDVARCLWRRYGEGSIGDDEANLLQSLIDRRRRPGRTSPSGHLKFCGRAAGRVTSRLGSRFSQRQRPRSSNRKASRDRRRTLGGSSVLPPELRCDYTEGQRAVLCIIAGEIKHHGICDLPIDKVGGLAGVCRTTVQTTIFLAQKAKHIKVVERPRPGQKHLSNIVTILSIAWNSWLKRAPSAHRPIGSNSVKMVSTTKSTEEDDVVAAGGDKAPSDLARQLASEVARIAGHDVNRLPQTWTTRNPHQIVQGWIDKLREVNIPAEQILNVARYVIARKPDKAPPRSIRYFEPTIIQVVEECARLLATLREGQAACHGCLKASDSCVE